QPSQGGVRIPAHEPFAGDPGHERPSSRRRNHPPRGCGELPAWEVTDLPGPPPFNFRHMIKVIGPGAVMAATSIGGGEWLVGPAAAVKYTPSIFLIVTVAIPLQIV